jgi:hypothetical protein
MSEENKDDSSHDSNHDANHDMTDDSSHDANHDLSQENTSGTAENISPGLPPTLLNPNEVNPKALEQIDPNALVRMNDYWSYDPRSHTIGLTSVLVGLDHAKLEEIASSVAAKVNAEGWTLLIDYFATGEGTHVWYKRVHDGTREAAVASFRASFFADSTEEAWAFWSQGLEVHEGSHWPEYVKGCKIPPDSLEMHWQSQL